MAVLDHKVHEKVKIDQGKPYGCHNGDRRMQGYYAPNRMAGSDGYKPMFRYEAVRIEHRMSKECRYDMSLTDPRCDGCNHRGSGERYNEMVRSKGK